MPWTRLPGILLFILGVFCLLLALRMHGTRLTPFPEPNPALGLLQNGLYAYVRHPMYLGLILGAVGLSLWQANLWAFGVSLLLCLFLNLKARKEELFLRALYPHCAAYQACTGRFLPRWRKAKNLNRTLKGGFEMRKAHPPT